MFHSDSGNVTSSINYVTRVIRRLEADLCNAALMQCVEREYLHEPDTRLFSGKCHLMLCKFQVKFALSGVLSG